MSKYTKQARALLDARKDRSAWNRGVTEYARDIFDTIEETEQYNSTHGKPYVFITRDAFTKAALNGADSWDHYSNCGMPLYCTWDIIERLNPPSMRDRLYSRAERGTYDAIGDQAHALVQACGRAWRAYHAQLPETIWYEEVGPWARACMPADCLGHHGLKENATSAHDLYMKDTLEARALIKHMPRGWDESLLSSFYSDGEKWYDLPFLWNGNTTLNLNGEIERC